MKKKILCVLLLMLVLTFSCSVVTFAAGDSGGIFPSLGDFLDFFKNIFIPSPNYFHNKISALNNKINGKLGGIGYLYSMLQNFFRLLSNGAPDIALNFTIPNNYLFQGFTGVSVDMLMSAKPYLKFMKDFLNVVCCLFTAIVCYHKLRSLFETGGGE